MALSQDLPPKGGYAPIQWKRNLPSRGFRPGIYFAIVTGICGYGFYKLIAGIRERNELARERQWGRIYLMPLLEAEADRDAYRRITSLRAKEQEVMADVADFDATKSVYNDPKFRKPAVIGFPKF
ncbi:NADH dehydrogenase [ubiquinone] 1 alpha subcomplex subunit 13 [Wickerhamiella sorbophila]|uniref:NADH dehydrogenase [ubiquinone] 1 alpha subcomplex subunit 13 n=1 Tax=Wickerhamiella sorbophila TaxID=45607 RepID=A0A2T0FG02_9ASCO|nr:NADH dehydrogenase [ubiquinone] 1 alpha subcomplex subunit 13 [Wickerhamiella sorbophila]PRT53921.1 NADH dehydrogenase [ubiquinone] 1 alpha subcomplex subunit 13 [Wickerhamiella sorbophila]